MTESFKGQIDDFIRDTKGAALAVFKAAAQDTIKQAQTSYNKSGFMPIDTSFLVNSGNATIDTFPSGPSEKPKDYALQEWNATETVTTINRIKEGQVLWFGWSANYAIYMENKFKFMRKAAQSWPDHVNKRAAQLKVK